MVGDSMITRRRFLKTTAALGLLANANIGAQERPSTAVQNSHGRKNVLFIVIDDLNHSLGCYGQRIVKSPNIDELASRGVRFEHSYCQFTVCNPSRTSFLTGLRPDTTGVLDNNTPFRSKLPDVVTLPQLFRLNGYFTASVGKIFHAGRNTDDSKAWDVTSDPRGTEIGKKGQGRNLTGGSVRWCRWLAAEGGDEDQPDGQVAAEAVRLLEQKRNSPFFLAVGFHKPHDPFIAPKPYFDLYPLETLQLPVVPADRSDGHPKAIGSGWKEDFDRFTDRERREFMRAYYAGISFMDAQVGKLIAAMDRMNLWGSTVVIFVSDHGYHLGDRGWWNKNTVFEASARAPLIAVTPEMESRGTSCSGIVEFVDIYPTLADLCGLSAPGNLAGISFRPLLNNPELPGKKAAFTQVQRGTIAGHSVRTLPWRYIEWDHGRQGSELYDHENDVGEFYNLAGDPKYAQTIAAMKRLLDETRQN